MPPSFIKRISRSSCAFSTVGPNHHQRIMIRVSSGGDANDFCRSSIGAEVATFSGRQSIVTNNKIATLRCRTGKSPAKAQRRKVKFEFMFSSLRLCAFAGDISYRDLVPRKTPGYQTECIAADRAQLPTMFQNPV